MRILVVDDEMVSRMKMQRIMQHYGDCVAVGSGNEALEAFTEALLNRVPFKLITLDVSMPDMGGTEVLSKIRMFESTNAVAKEDRAKILMVTSHADQETVMDGIKGGCDDYIIKPFTLELVTQKLNKIGLTSIAIG